MGHPGVHLQRKTLPGDGNWVSIARATTSDAFSRAQGAEGHHHRKSQGPLREKLDSSAVICCADTIPGMREEIVLGAVIELVTRTQLATDVETHSSNSDSN